MKKTVIIAIATMFSIAIQSATIGEWKAYMAYHTITEAQKVGNTVYALASNNLYSYNISDQSVQTYDKMNVLSDCDITHIAWCDAAKRLVITYNNSNIDLLDNSGNVYNMSDIYSKTMTDDKTINSLYIYNEYAYIATGFGIVKYNVRRNEISDTYNLGFNVQYCYIENGYIYAASPQKGIYRASVNNNLLDKNNWKVYQSYVSKTTTIDPEVLEILQNVNPGGPQYNLFGFMTYYNERLYTSGAGFSSIQELLRPGCIQVLSGNDTWNIYQDDMDLSGVRYIDINCLAIDPTNNNHVFAGGRTGLFEFLDGTFVKHYTIDNSPLVGATSSKSYVIVLGLTFDNSGNLYVFNGNNEKDRSILRLRKDGQWDNLHKEELVVDGTTMRIMKDAKFDSRGFLWFVNDDWRLPSLVCYNTNTDRVNVLSTIINQDGTHQTIEYAHGVTEDKNGNLWFVTNRGPFYIDSRDVSNAANGDEPGFYQVKVPRNDGTNYADYLLSGVDVSCIAIDGGNRKWFGTNGNGVYLISSDNLTQIHHFTAENSDLLSNNIESIALNEKTGEVFFGTDKGLCSYMSDASATSEKMTKDNVYAYPNPVRPEYNGLITIVGLTYDADVKIVGPAGTLIAEGRSNGGTFTWDGCDSKGRRVASGVYMVETATNDGSKGTVCKIAIVN